MNTDRKKNILYVVCTYAYFWILLSLVGIFILGNDSLIFLLPLAQIAGSWTPTIALLVLFKKLYPGCSVKGFFKTVFKERLNWKLIMLITMLQVLIIVAAAGIIAVTQEFSFSGLFDLSLQTIAMGFVISLITGATGEESGWRGFLQPSLERSNGVIKASLMIGIIWVFWHTPLWFLTSGFTGTDLIQYIASFMVSVVALSVIIGVCYSRCRNLLIPIWLHLMNNFILSVLVGEVMLDIATYAALLYVLIAIGYIAWHKKSLLKNAPKD